MPTAARINSQTLRHMDSDRKVAVIDAINEYDLSNSPEWVRLDGLSTRTEFDSLDAVPEGIFDAGNGVFEAVATLYVVLHYGNGSDSIRSTETFPAHVKGHFEDSAVKIDDVEVDISSFED
ncbi:MAG: hypothetical protein QHC90_30740 [Shinella sp.]|nr:hypothetical protein [Shinella sp.]